MAGVFLPSVVHQVAAGRNLHQPASLVTSTCLGVSGPPGGQDHVRRRGNGATVGRWGVGVHRWLAPDRGDSREQDWADFGPADQQQRADSVERGLAILAGDQRIGDVQGQGGEAGEDQ